MPEEAPLPPPETLEEGTLPVHLAKTEPAPPPGPEPALPAILGYELLEEVARGGMGVVYKAVQLSLKRVVALKMMLAGTFAGPEELRRFRAEAEAVARLRHPHIVQVHDFGTHGSLPYITMEFVEGGTLKQRLAGKRAAPHETAALVATLARAAHHAHEAGIVHRDLKPANVLWKEPGLPLLTDFGLAKRLDASQDSTASGAVMGTAPYMAPEQASGRTREIGPRTDVYALGAILYECLTGRPPFEGETRVDILVKVVTDDPVPPAQLRPEVPAALECICLKCLEKEPSRRYDSAAALADDLARFLAGEAPEAQPVPEWERHGQWARRAGYEVLELLGCGWAGFVYKARQVGLNRTVALKIMAGGRPADAEERSRFRREAEAIARLRHPNVVQVHDGGELAGLPFFAMEYIEGGTLSARFSENPPPVNEAALLVCRLAQAAHYAHEQGVVHRNLKPSNVLLTADGQPRIAGFGAARLRESGDVRERQNLFGRLASYMAPEQADGRLDRVGPATDVYGLGAILYFLLTGGPPFLADTLEATREQVRAQPPRPPRELRPEIPPRLEAICLRCLEKDPARRFPSARALGEELDRFLAAGAASSSRIGDCEIVEEVGRGSSGIVYKARDLRTGRDVALRVIADTLFPEQMAALVRTAEAVARLNHPHIATLYRFGEHEGRPFLVLEYVEGGNLAEHLRRRTWSPEEAARLLQPLALALAHAHAHGVLHRDLRPGNILLARDGTPKLTDFRYPAVPTPVAQTMVGTVLGPLGYLAPEQVAGDERTIGATTDVYGLGAILYEVLTGRPPFWGSSLFEVLLQVQRDPPPPPSALRPGLSPTLDAICLKCLEKDSGRRYPSASALADDLGLFLAGGTVAPSPARLWRRLLRWGKGRGRPRSPGGG